MKRLFVGPCPVCNERIFKFKRLPLVEWLSTGPKFNLFPVPYAQNEKGTHVWFLLSDGSRMAVAICKDCLSTLTDEQVSHIFADITYTKLLTVKPEQKNLYNAIRTVEVWKWFTSEKEVISYLKDKTFEPSRNP